MFYAELRSNDGQPVSGVEMGDIGAKMAYNETW
jgi:hypothetical protein